MVSAVRTRKRVTESGVTEADQEALALEAKVVQEQATIDHARQLDSSFQEISPMQAPTQQAIRRAEITSKLSDIEAQANTGGSIERAVETRIQKPNAFGRAVGKIPLVGSALNAMGIVQTRDKTIITEHIDENRPVDMRENARDQLNRMR